MNKQNLEATCNTTSDKQKQHRHVAAEKNLSTRRFLFSGTEGGIVATIDSHHRRQLGKEEKLPPKMADFQSTDGSFFSRETDEEKSFESMDDMLSMIGGIGKDTDKTGDGHKPLANIGTIGNDKGSGAGATANSSKTGDNEKGSATVSKKKTTKPKRLRKTLNEETLAAIEGFLKSAQCVSDTLEYEEVSAFNSKIHRYTVERTRGRQGMFFRDGTIQNGDDPTVKINPIILTEDDIAQERLYHNIYQREEFYAVATKFLKNVVDGAHDVGGTDFVLHTKTANWVKRAAGMQRQYDPYEKDDNQQYTRSRRPAYSEESDDGDGDAVSAGAASDRRMTRRRVQMTRKKQRLERKEKETENFRILSEVTLELSRQVGTGRTKRRLKQSRFAPIETTDDEDAEIVDAIPKEIGGPALAEAFPSLESTGLANLDSTYIRGGDAETRFWDGNEEEPHKMDGEVLPPVVARLGLEFRPRPVALEESSKAVHVAPSTSSGSGVTDKVRFRKSKMLRNALLNQRARRWAIHEFFYSDLDKEWYANDGFASDIAKLGLPIDASTRLTREEWGLIRRKIRPRPRLFSKRFIVEQLKKRNRHRALVRSLQQDPSATKFRPIPAGTPVTAYDKRGQTLRNGRVLLHDAKTHSYLVQFNDKESGCDVCPDFELAVSLPVKAAASSYSAPPSLYEPNEILSNCKAENEDVKELAIPKGIVSDGFVDEIERELLINSIAVVTEAFERKKAILEALESCTDYPGEAASRHCSRLLVNLDRINATLDEALAHLQILYGRVYGSPVSDNEIPKTEVEKTILSTEIPKNKSFEDLVASLESVSNQIGSAAISSGDEDLSSNERLEKDLSGSTSLLLLANYLAETSSNLADSAIEKTTYSSAMDAALKTLLDKYSKQCLPATPGASLVGKALEQESKVEDELKDLQVAVGMLRTEAALATDESRTFELSNAMV